MDWLVEDALGRTFTVFPVFALSMIALALVPSEQAQALVRSMAPLLYMAVVWAIAAAAAVAFPWQQATVALEEAFTPTIIAAVMAAVGLVAAPGLYLFELGVADRWLTLREGRQRTISRTIVVPVGPDAVEFRAPMGSAEAFDVVRRIARQPLWYGVISVLVAIGEEFLYRGLMLLLLTKAGVVMVVAVLVQAAAYALNHAPFGLPAFVGKFVAGLAFGVLTWVSDSLIPALGAHLALQVLVWHRLRRQDVGAATPA